MANLSERVTELLAKYPGSEEDRKKLEFTLSSLLKRAATQARATEILDDLEKKFSRRD